jgi:hypothetical protein
MTTPFTKEEINSMPNNILLELYKEQSSRLYPYCLKGQHIDDAKKRMKEWTNGRGVILISGKDGCAMNFNTTYYYCTINNETNIITKIYSANI